MPLVLKQRITWRLAALVACEAALIVAAVSLSAEWLAPGIGPRAASRALLVAVIVQLCLYYGDLYDPRRVADKRELMARLLQSAGAAALLIGFVYALVPGLIVASGVLPVSVFLSVLFIVAWRFGFDWLTRAVGPRERLLIVGTNAAAVTLARELYERRELGVDLVGFVDPDRQRVGMPVINPGVIGTIEDIPTIVRDRHIDRVVVSLADARGQLPMQKLLDMKLQDGVTFDHLASVYEEYTGKIAIEDLRPSWLIFSSGFRHRVLLSGSKRAADFVLSALGLLLAWPVMLAIALAIRIASPGPVFYHQRRVGKGGRVFTIHKFRTMNVDAEKGTGAVWADPKDARVFPLGRLLRKTRLDELPQLCNVLAGDMSVVGPRPERPEFVEQLATEIPFYNQRHVVKPGVTGWAQVRYTYGASVEDALQKLQYDLFYIKNQSVALDLWIVFETVKIVLLRRGSQ